MKVVISESVRNNLTSLIPIDEMSAMELMSGFITDSRRPESEFSKQCRAAKFIFEDVITFHPPRYSVEDSQSYLVRGLKKVPTRNDKGALLTLVEWKTQAIRSLDGIADETEISLAINKSLPIQAEGGDSVILSQDPFITAAQIQQRNGLSKEALLYLLATAGIDITLPSIVAKNDDDINELKLEFEEERLDYLLYLSKSLDSMIAAASSASPDVASVYEFAQNKFAIDLKLKSMKIAAIAAKKRKRVVDSIFSEFLSQASTIASSAVRGDFIGAGQALFKSLLSLANGERDTLKAMAEHKEVAYIYKIATAK